MRIRDPRSKVQRYCSQPQCKRASKAHSQRLWSSKPENHDYFTGEANSERVRQWRKTHLGYETKPNRGPKGPLQDLIETYLVDNKVVVVGEREKLLQDHMRLQTALVVGLVSILSEATLQDEIAKILRSCLNRGGDILIGNSLEKPRALGGHDSEQPPVNPQGR